MSTPTRLDSHDEWPDEDYPENVLHGDFLHGSWELVPSLIRDADTDLPKYSHEGHSTIFGPLDELTPEMFDGLADAARSQESWCSGMADYQSAEQYLALRREFENLALGLREDRR